MCAKVTDRGPRPPRTVIIGQEDRSGGWLRYVALGDSCTIGTSVAEYGRRPNQLVRRLDGSVGLELIASLGVDAIAPAVGELL